MLDLSQAPTTLFLFGLAGAGKNFVGDLIGRMAGWHVYHADSDMPPEMQLARERKERFTDEMRAHYFPLIADRILELRRHHPRIVVTQAAYRQVNRDYLVSRIPDMELIWITADDSVIIDRLRERGDDITPEYAATFRANFEPPPPDSKRIENNGDAITVVSQLNGYFARPRPGKNS